MEPDLTADELEALQAEWDAILSKEGLSTRIHKKQIRGSRNPELAKRTGMDRSKAIMREVTVSPDQAWVYDQAPPNASDAPENAWEALLLAKPHDSPQESKDAAQDALDALMDSITEIVGPRMADLIYRNKVAGVTAADLAHEQQVTPAAMATAISRALARIRKNLNYE